MSVTHLPNTPFRLTPRIVHGARQRTLGVVLHTIEGTDTSAIEHFRGHSPDGVGAHVVFGRRRVVQLADLDALCFHAVGANHKWIGFEHEGFARYSKARWLTLNRRMLRMSANRTAWVCWHYRLGLPTWGTNIKGHVDFPAGGHTDPGAGWPRAFYVWLARRAYRRITNNHGSWA